MASLCDNRVIDTPVFFGIHFQFYGVGIHTGVFRHGGVTP